MGFAARLADMHDSDPSWAAVRLVYVVNQPPSTLEHGSIEHLKDQCFGIGEAARRAGEARRTVLLDPHRRFYAALGTRELSVVGLFARILSGY